MATNDPSKMVGGADAFICDVISKNTVKKTWKVRPRITEVDGTNHPMIDVNAVGGLDPVVGDVVLVVTARNNLDDKKISRFYPPTEANGRIIAIAKPVTKYFFEGDFEFDGDVVFTGNVTIEKDLTVRKNLTVDEDAEVGGDLTVDGEVKASDAVLGNIRFSTHTHTSSAPGVQTGPPQGAP